MHRVLLLIAILCPQFLFADPHKNDGAFTVLELTVKPHQTIWSANFPTSRPDDLSGIGCFTAEALNWEFAILKELHKCMRRAPTGLENSTRVLTHWMNCPRMEILELNLISSNKLSQIASESTLDWFLKCGGKYAGKKDPMNNKGKAISCQALTYDSKATGTTSPTNYTYESLDTTESRTCYVSTHCSLLVMLLTLNFTTII